MNKWLVASYKINEVDIVQKNLENQNFEYFLPKIFTKKDNSNLLSSDIMFPGYIFINTNINKYSTLQYTKGIKKVLKYGNSISCINEDDIKSIKKIEQTSKVKPIISNIYIGQEVLIKGGFLKDNIVKICSLPANKRIDILIYILGSKRNINISLKQLLI